jgi:phage terminase large subunit GpA-like protein
MCYVAPIMYHLFELQETVIIGLPTMQMAQDKWTEDLLPAIEASRYASLLPTSGEGSRGGMVKRAIRFRNDVSLRFMTAGGGDKQRAGYTSRVLAITETDGMDEAGVTSREADAIEQLEGRTRAYGSGKRVYLECTASIERGRIWQEITHGTDSRIYRPCPYCGQYVSPERQHLVGWAEAESEIEAAEKTHWVCPECSHGWTEDDRRDVASSVVLVHRGQKALPSGDIVGNLPPTKTFGFRWSAIDNPFAATGDIGAEEWRARRSHDSENAEKKMRQFVWCLPYDPPEIELTPIDAEAVAKRSLGDRKGIVPAGCLGVAIGVDTGKQELYWQATAILQNGSAQVIEYGKQPTDANRVGLLRGLVDALTRLRDYFAPWNPAQVWIDSGWHEHRAAVYEFCRLANIKCQFGQEIYRPAKGYGERQRGTTRYFAPKSRAGEIKYIGLEYDFRYQRAEQTILVHVNSDFWKSNLHQRLAMAPNQPGTVTLYEAASSDEHVEYSQQITAEIQKAQWIDGRGEIIIWDRIRRQNHYLDAGYLSIAAGHFVATEIKRQKASPVLSLAEMAAASGGANG